MRGTASRAHYLLLGGTALAAMSVGHAIVLWIAPPAPYRHILQGPAAELLLALGVFSAAGMYRRIVRVARCGKRQIDWALPAFRGIEALGVQGVVASLICVQLLLLAAGETTEHLAAGVSITNVAAVFGGSSLVALVVHATIGTLFGFVLWRTSRRVNAIAGRLVVAVRAVLMWLSAIDARHHPSYRRTFAFAFTLPPPRPIAHKIANRPPPAHLHIA